MDTTYRLQLRDDTGTVVHEFFADWVKDDADLIQWLRDEANSLEEGSSDPVFADE